MKKYIYGIVIFALIIIGCLCMAGTVHAAEPDLKLIDATAYYDSYGHGHGAKGGRLIEGVTCAYRPEDIGKTAIIYDINKRLIGIYEITDTGYGQSTGYGKSNVLPGLSVGTIECGQCVDVYFTNYSKCKAWGRRKVYIQVINAEG